MSPLKPYTQPNLQKLALTDSDSDNATAPRRPDQTKIIASFQSKP